MLKEVIIAYCKVLSNTYLVGLRKTMEKLGKPQSGYMVSG
jgi:hypothetical protein